MLSDSFKGLREPFRTLDKKFIFKSFKNVMKSSKRLKSATISHMTLTFDPFYLYFVLFSTVNFIKIHSL